MSRKRPAWARIAPVNATAEELKTLVGALTSSDEAQRREAVTNVLAREPVLCWHLADRLVDRLVDGRGAVPRQSAASLVEMGDAVAAVLVLRLYQAQSAEVREELV